MPVYFSGEKFCETRPRPWNWTSCQGPRAPPTAELPAGTWLLRVSHLYLPVVETRSLTLVNLNVQLATCNRYRLSAHPLLGRVFSLFVELVIDFVTLIHLSSL